MFGNLYYFNQKQVSADIKITPLLETTHNFGRLRTPPTNKCFTLLI